MKASDLFIKVLENERVKFIFGIPGEENLDLLESIRVSGIRLVLTRHEQAAGFMAATIGRLTGKPGVVLSTLGPGASNLVSAAAYAQLGGMPLLMITGQKPIKKSKQGRFQIVDAVEMMEPLTKYTKQIVNGNTIPSVLRRSFKIAMEERPGSVHLELPEDIAIEEAGDRIFPVHEVRRPSADEKAVQHALDMIQSSKSPLILIGAGANRKRTGHALLKFIDKSGIHFFNTQMGKGVIHEGHPLFLGTAVISAGDIIHRAIDHADLIINIGHDVIEKPPFFMKQEGQQVVHVNYFSSETDDVYFPQLDVVGDIASSIKHISTHLNHNLHWDDSLYIEVKKEIREDINRKGSDRTFPLRPQALIALLQRLLPQDAILALDNGLYKIHFARNYLCSAPNTLLLDNALAAMGAGLPSAIAAKLLHPEKEVLCIAGDGGFMMNSQELETAVRLGIDLVVLVLSDKALGMIKDKQKKKGFMNFGLEFDNPDFVKYAESYGARGYRVNSHQEFTALVESCLKLPGVHLLEVPIDYS